MSFQVSHPAMKQERHICESSHRGQTTRKDKADEAGAARQRRLRGLRAIKTRVRGRTISECPLFPDDDRWCLAGGNVYIRCTLYAVLTVFSLSNRTADFLETTSV